MTAEEFAAMERRARMFEAANEKMLADNKRLREENARLREALKDLIEEDEYQTCSGEEEDGIVRAAARAAIREGGKSE